MPYDDQAGGRALARDVFISYRHEDKAWADRLCRALEAQNVSCWVAFRDIPVGADWPAEIMDGLQRSRFFVLLLSAASAHEEQISREVRIASDQLKIPIFPFRIEDVQPPKKIGYFLGDIQWLDAFDGQFDSAVEKLVERIRIAGPAVEQAPIRSVVSANPTVAAPVAASRSSALPSVQQPSRKNLIWLALSSVALVAIALVLYFHFAGQRNLPDIIPREGIIAGDRFLSDLNSAEFEAAWGELTPGHRSKENHDRWIREHVSAHSRNGAFTFDPPNCKLEPQKERYACKYGLRYADGKSGTATLGIMRQQGVWGVASSALTEPN